MKLVAALSFAGGIAFGLAVSRVAAPSASAGEPGALLGAPRIEAPAEPADVEAAEAPAARARFSAPSPAAPASSGASAPAIAALVESFALPRVGAGGDGKIVGKVRTADNAPLAGVLVRAKAVPLEAKPGDVAPDDDDLAGQLRALVAAHERRRALSREATTGPDGSYVLAGLAAGGYDLAAELAGYAIAPRGLGHAGPAKAGDTWEFLATPVVRVRATVLLPSGASPAEASIVAARGGGSSDAKPWTPAHPEVAFPPGAYELYAQVIDEAGVELVSEQQGVKLELGGAPVELALEVHGRPGIAGRVLGPVLGQTYVQALRFTGPTPDAERIARDGETQWLSGDRFAFRGIARGTYALSFSRGAIVVATQVVEVGEGTTLVDVAVPEPDRASVVALTLLDAAGKQLLDPGATFSFYLRVPRLGGSGSSVTPIEQEDGTLWLPFDAEAARPYFAGDASSRFTLYVSTSDYGQREVAVPRRAEPALTIQLAAPAVLEVTVAGYVGDAVEGALSLGLRRSVTREGEEESTEWTNVETVGPEGKILLPPVEPGAWELVVNTSAGRRAGRLEVDHVPVTLQAGRNEMTIAAPRVRPLTVIGPPDGQLTLRSANDSVSARFGRDGTAHLDAVPVGAYRLQAYGQTEDGNSVNGEMSITVPAPDDLVRFEPEVQNAALVRVDDADGYLASIGLATGDFVIAVNGVDGTDLSAFWQALFQSEGAVELTVRRGGATFTVTAESPKLGNGGGSFQPAAAK